MSGAGSSKEPIDLMSEDEVHVDLQTDDEYKLLVQNM